MVNWMKWLRDKPAPKAPNIGDEKVLSQYATTFMHLKEHGLDLLLDLLESNAAASIRTFRDVSSHTEMCKLQGEIQAYMSVREAVDTVIRSYQQRMEDKRNGE